MSDEVSPATPEREAAPAAAVTAGSLLREARQAQGLHIAALAASIKVPQRKLEALEGDRLDELPDPTFTRALAQTVCRTLKIDAGPVLALLPRGAASERLEHVSQGINAPFRSRSVRREGFDTARLASPAVWAPALLVLAAVVVYLLPAGWLQSGRNATAPTPAASAPALAASPSETAASSVAGASAPMTARSEAAAAEPTPALAVASSSPAGDVAGPAVSTAATAASSAPPLSAAALNVASATSPLAAATSASASSRSISPPTSPTAVPASAAGPRATPMALSPVGPAASGGAGASTLAGAQGALQLRAGGDSWVEVRDAGGRVLLSRALVAGEAVSLDGPLPLRATIGNAAGTQVVFRGKPVDLVAATKNNVARLELK